MSKTLIINFALFQLGWFACVLGGAYNLSAIGSLIAILVIAFHIYNAVDKKQENTFLFITLIIGVLFESTITATGLAQYNSGQVHHMVAPLWMILMWPLFATTINISMAWLKKLGLLYVSIVGAVFAPLAYYSGSKLGAVYYEDVILSLSIIAASWAVLLPVLMTISTRCNGYRHSIVSTDKVMNHV